VRLRPDGTDLEIVSRGVRNILDVAVDAEDELFTYDNTDENQWMGRLTHMVDGGFYGYPFDFIPRRDYTLWMFADYGPGAACGTLAYNDDALPSEYRGNLFLADFGQRNLRRVTLERAAGTFRAVSDQLLFPDPPPDFRPVGIHETPDGRGFYICDWQHQDNKQEVTVGRLWKLTALFATNAAPLPVWYVPAALGRPAEAETQALVAGLAHPRKQVRLVAQRALVRRGPAIAAALRSVFADDKAPLLSRYHALWALDALDRGQSIRPQLIEAVSGSSAGLARQAMRQLGQCGAREAGPALLTRLRDPDPSLRFYAATALGRIADPRSVSPLLQALRGPEPELWPRFALFTALHRIGTAHPEAWSEIAGALSLENETARAAVGFALRDVYDVRLVEAVIGVATNRLLTTEARASALSLLRLMHRQVPAWNGEWWSYHPFRLTPPARTVAWEGTARVGDALRAVLAESDERLRLAAIKAVTEAGEGGAVPDLRALWSSDGRPAVRRALVQALGELGDGNFVPDLLTVAGDSAADQDLRLSAIRSASLLWDKAPSKQSELGQALLEWLRPNRLPVGARREAIAMVERARFTNAVNPLMELARSQDPPEREAAVHALGALGGDVSFSPLSALATNAPLETRREALVALGQLRNKTALPLLLQAAREPFTRDAAWRALAAQPSLEALDSYLDAMNSPEVVTRDRARRAFDQIKQEALVELEKRGDKLVLSPRVRGELQRVYQNDPESAKKPFLQANANEAAPSPEEYARQAVAKSGDPWRGQRIFFEEQRTACIRCHAVHGWGGGVGPELTTAGAQFGRATLIESILFPSKTVREGYQQIEIELKSGEIYNGLVKAENATAVILLDAEGRQQPIARDQIAARRNSRLSLMPEGLQAALSLDEFTDLVAYVESLKVDPRRPVLQARTAGWQLIRGMGLEGWRVGDAIGRAAGPGPLGWFRHENVLEGSPDSSILWSETDLTNFVLRFEWRWVDPPQLKDCPILDAQGQPERGEAGAFLVERVLDAGEASVFLREPFGLAVRLSCDPMGSGSVARVPRVDQAPPPLLGLPRVRSDRPVGQWNQMEITVRGDTVSANLNGTEILPIVRVPALPAAGPIGLCMGRAGRIQFKDIFATPLPTKVD
ncbi:MAG TPA: HEAT repeat domain-containing protein, partial [Verrucomicrobiae bacterium]|nr:HEAT repeat domain-containing protein [Verrucomicrobiae bacterium]